MVVVDHNYPEIKGDLDITVTFLQYGGTCIAKYNECNSQIQYTRDGFFGSFSVPTCSQTEGDCMFNLKCTDCILEALAYINIVSYEHEAYSASIETNVTATSSIPNEDSHISY
jgi:hypothetical protein